MKKIIFGLLVAFVALSFMGCPTTYDDLDYAVLTVGDIIGDMDGAGMPLTASGVFAGFKTESFTYSNSMKAWGGGDGICNFKIRKIAGQWAGDYKYPAVKIDSLPNGVKAENAGGNDQNIRFTGLVDGKKYHFEIIAIAPFPVISLIED